MKNISQFIFVTISTVLLFFPAHGNAESVNENQLFIGALLPLSGDAAAYGLPAKYVIEYAVSKINEAGGIQGRQLNIQWEDSRCTSDSARFATQKMLDKNISIIIGGICSSETLAAAALTEPKHIILFSPTASAPMISNAGDFVFRNMPADPLQGHILAQYVLKKGYRTVGILDEDQPYVQNIRKTFIKTMEENQGKVFVIKHTKNPDITQSLIQLSKKGADAIFINYQSATKNLLRGMRKASLKKPLILTDVFENSSTLKGNKRLLNGAAILSIDFDTKHSEFKKLKKWYRKKYDEPLPHGAYMSRVYDAVFILKESIEKTGDENDTEGIKNYLSSIKNRPGLAGMLTFDKNGDPEQGFAVKIILNGKIKPLP